MELTLQCKVQYLNDIDPFDHRSNVPEPVRPPTYVFLTNVPLFNQLGNVKRLLQAPHKLEDCALQLCKCHGGQLEFLSYLDLDQTLDDQQEELEEFKNNKRNVIMLRTQLSVRVQCCLDKLVNASAKELKKYLFALKQVLQDDKDLVHEFVDNDGLDCLIRITQQAEPNSIYYVLKALGQLMLYVDGMNGVMLHNKTIQWLYSFINSQPRLVVKMSLKLLLVFVEYNDSNWQLFTQAINNEDSITGSKPWSNFMKMMQDDTLVDVEVLVYAMTLINKTLSAVPDQDTFYDITDSLEEQGIEAFMKNHRESGKEERDLLEQFDVYDSLVSLEDGDVSPNAFAAGFRKLHKARSSEDIKRTRRRSADVPSCKSKSPAIHSNLLHVTSRNGFHKGDVTQSSPSIPELLEELTSDNNKSISNDDLQPNNDEDTTSIKGSSHLNDIIVNDNNTSSPNDGNDDDDDRIHSQSTEPQQTMYSSTISFPSLTSQMGRQSMNRRQRRQRQQSQLMEMIQHSSSHDQEESTLTDDFQLTSRGVELPQINFTSDVDEVFQNQSEIINLNSSQKPNNDNNESHRDETKDDEKRVVEDQPQTKLSHPESLKDLENNTIYDPNASENKKATAVFEEQSRVNLSKIGKHVSLDETKASFSGDDFASKVCAAKNQLKSTKLSLKKHDSGPPSTALGKLCETITKPYLAWNAKRQQQNKPAEPKQDAIHWSDLEKESLKLPIRIKEADFTDLSELDDQDFLIGHSKMATNLLNGSSVDPSSSSSSSPLPPPPPPLPPPILNNLGPPAPPLPPPSGAPPPPPLPPSLDTLKGETTLRKKMKLHWREANYKFSTPNGKVSSTIWEELRKEVGDVRIDRVKFEALFEIRTQDIKAKKLELTKKELSILDQKRSNAINIGMIHLPKAGAIKNAILSMDNSVLSREDIEKILVGMMPTEEEKTKILEVQRSNDLSDLQLGTAEQFLLTIGSISELESRLRLWIYKMDYDSIESEICDPLFDLKKGMGELKRCKTFKFILSTLLSIGNFLNNSQVSGFTLDYLVKVVEVKDNVYKHTLLHHLVNIILDTFPESNDLYLEIGSVIRCAKVDWEDLKEKLQKLEADCDSSVEHLRSIVKQDSAFQSKHRMQETLADFAKRIVLVKIVYRRVINRFKKFLLWLGYSIDEARTVTVNQLCQAVSEFALEYRTTREKVMNIRVKKANMRERKKTRGVMIVQTEKFATKAKMLPTLGEDVGGGELETLLQNGSRLKPVKTRSRRSLDPRTFQRSLAVSKSNIRESESISLRKSTGTEAEEIIAKDSPKESEQGGIIPSSTESAEDDLLEAVLRSVTSTTEPKTRERRRARNVERKSLRRTLKSGLSIEEVAAVEKFG